MSAPVDLRELAIERRPRPAARRGRPRPWLTRYLIPIVILAGFCAVLGWTLRDELLPGTPVTVLPVITARGQVEESSTPLFPAAGWVEPRPHPIMVTSMLEGIIERITVLEGDTVTAGQPVAYLVQQDAEIAVRQAEAELQLRLAEYTSAEAQLESAKTYFEEPIQRQAELAEAESNLAKVQTELRRMPALQRGAEARAKQAGNEFESRSKSKETNGRLSIERAQAEYQVSQAAVDELREQAQSLELERTALARRRDVLKRIIDLKIDEKRALREAEANVKAGAAKRQQAQVSLESARLRLKRTVITAPITGKVLSLIARPGSKLMGLERAAMLDASTVLTMYDPKQLQIRVDVRLEELSRVSVGQPVRIETPAVTGALVGRVIATTSIADIQKNTLQVKVAVEDPPAILRPDMLVQVNFLAPQRPKSTKPTESPLQILIPRAIVESVGDKSSVWIVDAAAGTAAHRLITIGNATAGELVEVKSGLNVGDRLIIEGRNLLRDGARIQIEGEDQSLGRTPPATRSPPKGAGPTK